MSKKFNFEKAVSSAKSVYNKSYTGFKKVNTVAKKIDMDIVFLNKHAKMVNSITAIHKDRGERK